MKKTPRHFFFSHIENQFKSSNTQKTKGDFGERIGHRPRGEKVPGDGNRSE